MTEWTWPITLRAYNYFINGWGNDQDANYQRALKVQKKLNQYDRYHGGRRGGKIYLYNDHSNYKIPTLFQDPKCCWGRLATFYFYYLDPDTPVPALGPLCDDCLAKLDDSKIHQTGEMVEKIIKRTQSNLLDELEDNYNYLYDGDYDDW